MIDRVSLDYERLDLPSKWDVVPFAETLDSRRFSVAKIKRTDYLPQGEVPVIDQGQEFIAGYWNDLKDAYDGPLPVIVFGDHTRALKFLDFRFVCGADGTKVLVPNQNLFDPEFLYYALGALALPSRGYNRHFRILKEKLLPMPPLSEQKAIGHVLRTVQRAKEATEQVIVAARELKKSLMRHLFTYGPVAIREVGNVKLVGAERIGEVPEEWELRPLRDVAEVVTGRTPPTADQGSFGGPFPFLTPGDITDDNRMQVAGRTLSEAGLRHVRPLPRGSTLVVCIGASIGKVGMTDTEISATNQQINAAIPGDTIDPSFLYYAMQHASPRIVGDARRTTMPILSKSSFEQLLLPIPPLGKQVEVAGALGVLDRKIDAEEADRDALSALLDSLLHDLMTARVRVADLEVAG